MGEDTNLLSLVLKKVMIMKTTYVCSAGFTGLLSDSDGTEENWKTTKG
jgi:hypothetical protein